MITWNGFPAYWAQVLCSYLFIPHMMLAYWHSAIKMVSATVSNCMSFCSSWTNIEHAKCIFAYYYLATCIPKEQHAYCVSIFRRLCCHNNRLIWSRAFLELNSKFTVSAKACQVFTSEIVCSLLGEKKILFYFWVFWLLSVLAAMKT